MFIIPCKFSHASQHIIPLVSQIRQFHPNEKIVIVDSCSEDKGYFEKLRPYDVIIEDVSNRYWMVGAFWHGYEKYPNEEYYYFLHDSMRVKANLDYLKNNDLVLVATFHRNVAPGFNAWNDRIKNETGYGKHVKIDGMGCHGPIFFCKNKVIKSLYNNGANKLLPSNKPETGHMEGAFGLFFEAEGYDLMQCSLYGDILQLTLPGGKCGPYPHNTAWEFPVEKFYASYGDERRR